MRTARTLRRPPGKRHPVIGGEFRRFTLGRRLVYLRNDLIAHAGEIVAAVEHSQARLSPGSSMNGAGNRGSGFRLNPAGGPELFIRYARRGGVIRFIVNDYYLGLRPRPLRELAVAAEARRRGIAIAEPLGAIIDRIIPGVYRGAFVTQALRGMTLWQFVQTDDDPEVRLHVVAQARRAIDSAHQKGLFHADLNLHNIFVTRAGESFSVVLIDLDKARIYPAALADSSRANNLARLRRSIMKLDSERRCFSQGLIDTLTGN
jgi:tRNA A-37 threonylcarbamoyl transferase component Bud32